MVTKNGKTVLIDTNGNYKTGWQLYNGKWYYIDSSSGVIKGWKQLSWSGGNDRFYFDKSTGAMTTGWQQIDGTWYYLDPSSGAMKTGWQTIDGKKYYMKSDGKMVTGTVKINGKNYTFDSSGAWKGYATGAKRIGANELAWTMENGAETIVRASDHAVLTRVGTGDRIYNAMATDNLWNAANNPSKFVSDNLNTSLIRTGVKTFGGSSVEQNFENINFVLDGIRNYDEFIKRLQGDNRFEKLIDAMTSKKYIGGSSIGKYAVKI